MGNQELSYFYKLYMHGDPNKYSYISSSLEPDSVKRLIFFFQAYVNVNFCESIILDPDDIIQMLLKHCGFMKVTFVPVNEKFNIIEMNDVWNEMISEFNRILEEEGLYISDIENDLYNLVKKKYSSVFLFIDAGLRLPKWAEKIQFEPLTMEVTHNGVLIQGLDIISENDRNSILDFFPKCKFYDNNSLFFDFMEFPAYNYSFSWNGRHIKICEVKEYTNKPSEVIKQMNLGYFLNYIDFKLPIRSLNELNVLKKKMRML